MTDMKDKELPEKDLEKASGGAVDPRLQFKTGHVQPDSNPEPVDRPGSVERKGTKLPGTTVNPL